MMYTTKITQGEDKGFGRKIISIYKGNEKIGEYERNYSAYGESTFAPFHLNGKDYALYSKHYTATSLMSLPKCEYIGGEKPDTFGFCPVELYVPKFRCVTTTFKKSGLEITRYIFDNSSELEDSKFNTEDAVTIEDEDDINILSKWEYAPFGFVAGCIWGDDSSWKIEFIDLSKVDEAIIVRDNRFGYWELPDNMCLRDVINLDTSDGKYFSIDAIRKEHYYNINEPIEKFKNNNP